MADINIENLKEKAQVAFEEAGKAATEAVEAAKPMVEDAAAKGAAAVEGAAAAAKPVVEDAVAKASDLVKQAGLDKAFENVSHDAGVVVEAAKNKLEETLNTDLDGDGKIG